MAFAGSCPAAFAATSKPRALGRFSAAPPLAPRSLRLSDESAGVYDRSSLEAYATWTAGCQLERPASVTEWC